MLLFRKVAKVVKAGEAGKVGKGVRARDGRAGQAALEFLLNYGWAILGVLVVLGGLARFGVLSPANLVPEKCSFPGSVGCPDFEVGSNGIRLILQNRAGRDIVVSGIGFGSDALSQSSGGCSTGAVNAVVKNGAKATFYANDPINCAFKDTGRPKNKYNVTVAYSFLGSQGISHSLSGELLAKKGEGMVSSGEGEYGGGISDPALVGYWKFDEGSGTSASDSSASGNAGTLNGFGCTTLDCDPNSGWTSAGKMGRALAFEGVNDFVSVADDDSLDFGTSDDFAITAWINVKGLATQTILDKWDANGNQRSFAFWINGGNRLSVRKTSAGTAGTGSQANSNTITISANTWHHAAVAKSGTTLNFYFNGAAVGSPTLSGGWYTGTAPLSMGNGSEIGDHGGQFNGAIDEVMVWNRLLSAQEIAALAAQ